MIAIVALFLIAILVVVVPAIAASVARSVANNRSPSSGSIDQSLVEARLGRIEEAIDAMAVQIERLSEHQRALLGPEEPSRSKIES